MADKFTADKFTADMFTADMFTADMFTADIFVADMFCDGASVAENRGVERGCSLACPVMHAQATIDPTVSRASPLLDRYMPWFD
jgi:hypothetical protein